MFKSGLIVLTLFVSSVLAYAAAEKTTTLEGTLVASVCYIPDHSNTGNDMGPAKECGSECLRKGTPGGLLTKDGTFYLLEASSLALAPYVGQQIRVSGEEYSKDIFLVKTAAVRSGGGWEGIDFRSHKKE